MKKCRNYGNPVIQKYRYTEIQKLKKIKKIQKNRKKIKQKYRRREPMTETQKDIK